MVAGGEAERGRKEELMVKHEGPADPVERSGLHIGRRHHSHSQVLHNVA
jgi:hypothetical protein